MKKVVIGMLCIAWFSCSNADGKSEEPPVAPPDGLYEQIEDYEDDNIVLYSFPAEEQDKLNNTYKVYVNDRRTVVYTGKIGPEDDQRRWLAMDDPENSSQYYDPCGFSYFDMKKGPANIKVVIDRSVRSAKVLPESAGIVPDIDGMTVSFDVSSPQHLTVEINEEHVKSLHIFINPEETDRPDPDDPNVIYYGPGLHKIDRGLFVKDNQTVYVAGGAIVRCNEPTDGTTYPSIQLNGSNITLRGRGIIDGENIANTDGRKRTMVLARGANIDVEGVVLRNSSTWHCEYRGVETGHIDNIKILGHRGASDGIDICDSFDILIENCFIRTLDDLVVVKSDGVGCARIVTRKCALWNGVAHALSLGAELRGPVEDVLFTDCDIIGDGSREWTLRIYHCDHTMINNIRWENIRIEESTRLASLWVGEAKYTIIPGGNIRDVEFKNITVSDPRHTLKERLVFEGYSLASTIEGVLIDNFTIDGRKVTEGDITMNEFVSGVTIR